MKRNLVVNEHRGSGEWLSPTFLQTERESCVENVHLELSAWVTSSCAAVEIAGIKTWYFTNVTVTTRPDQVVLGRKNGSGRNDFEQFCRSIYRGKSAESSIL